MASEAREVLKENELRVTVNRLSVLEQFLNHGRAYSLADLEKKLDIDRSTIFRCLQVFNDCHILERFNDANGNYVYTFAETHHHCTKEEHLHFKCNECHNTIALPKLPPEYLSSLSEHKVETLNLLIEGVCRTCKVKEPL